MAPLIATTSLGMTAALVLFGTWSGGVDPALSEGPTLQDVAYYANWPMAVLATASTSGVDVDRGAEVAVPDGAVMAQRLKDESGLTADQIGKMLGVTRRSVHNWAAGAAIAAKHQVRLEQLHDLVFGLTVHTPDERRDILLDSVTGPSLYRQFAEGTARAVRVQYPVPAIERFA